MKKRTPLVSCIIPTYNREKFLPISIGSVLKQTYKNWELIIVDDRSTDGTKKLIEKYMKKDKRIKYVKNIHKQGPSGARNQGIELAKGKYIAFLDSDDEWMSFHLEEMIYYLEKYPDRIDLMTANVIRKNYFSKKVYNFDKLKMVGYNFTKIENSFLFNKDKLFNTSLRKRIITTQTIVCKKNILKKINFHEKLLAATDCLFVRELAYHKIKIAHLQKYHVIYWAHDENITNCGGKKSIKDQIKTNLEFEKYHNIMKNIFNLNWSQKRLINKSLSNLNFWQIGYSGYLQLNDYKNAKKYFIKGLLLDKFNFKMWKTYIKRIILRK
jgi:glycosyltransferase involved in cell wall biosynthesis